MTKPDKPEWLVPISRVVHHAIQPGTIRVKADTAADALRIAADLVESRDAMEREEWEPVSEIQDASSPEIADDLDESDVLRLDDTTARALREPIQAEEAGQ